MDIQTLLLHLSIQVVAYEGELLMQHCHDDTVITLLQTSISDSAPTAYIKARLSNEVPHEQQKGRSFECVVLPEGEFPKVCITIMIVIKPGGDALQYRHRY